MAKQYIGISPLTVVRTKSTGAGVYVYAGQPVTSDISTDERERLLAEGFIAEVPELAPELDVVEPVVADPGSENAVTSEQVTEPVRSEVVPTNEVPAPSSSRPAPTATKAEWVAYASELLAKSGGLAGYTKEQAEEFTRAELIEKLP